jgi:hypothetical protein
MRWSTGFALELVIPVGMSGVRRQIVYPLDLALRRRCNYGTVDVSGPPSRQEDQVLRYCYVEMSDWAAGHVDEVADSATSFL